MAELTQEQQDKLEEAVEVLISIVGEEDLTSSFGPSDLRGGMMDSVFETLNFYVVLKQIYAHYKADGDPAEQAIGMIDNGESLFEVVEFLKEHGIEVEQL